MVPSALLQIEMGMSRALSWEGCAAQWTIKSKRCLEKIIQRIAITNIDAGVLKLLGGTLQPLQVPGGVALRPKKQLAHVVVHPITRWPCASKILHGFGADQSAAAVTRIVSCVLHKF